MSAGICRWPARMTTASGTDQFRGPHVSPCPAAGRHSAHTRGTDHTRGDLSPRGLGRGARASLVLSPTASGPSRAKHDDRGSIIKEGGCLRAVPAVLLQTTHLCSPGDTGHLLTLTDTPEFQGQEEVEGACTRPHVSPEGPTLWGRQECNFQCSFLLTRVCAPGSVPLGAADPRHSHSSGSAAECPGYCGGLSSVPSPSPGRQEHRWCAKHRPSQTPSRVLCEAGWPRVRTRFRQNSVTKRKPPRRSIRPRPSQTTAEQMHTCEPNHETQATGQAEGETRQVPGGGHSPLGNAGHGSRHGGWGRPTEEGLRARLVRKGLASPLLFKKELGGTTG